MSINEADEASPVEEAVWVDVECGSYGADLPIWRELVAAASSDGACELLDVGCGTGRVALALASPSCRVTAIDSDPSVLHALRTRASKRGAPVEAVHADARSFELDRRFDLALAPMQLVQLLPTVRDRVAMLSSVARHLKRRARFALALLDLDEEWEASGSDAPVPDMLEREGWVYASHPVAVRSAGDGSMIELDRIRRVVSPAGEVSASPSRIRLALVAPEQLEREARKAGLAAEPRRTIAETDVHTGSAVVVLRRDG